MSGLLARAGRLFLAPAQPAVARVAPPPADLVGVLAGPRELPAAAGMLAADVRRRHRAKATLVCAASAPIPGPSTRAARALACRLADREITAVARGTVCQVQVAAEDPAAQAWRAITAAAGIPAVVALTARDDGWDALLAEADAVFVAPPPEAEPSYVELALASLAALGPRARVLTPPSGILARRLATLGLGRARCHPDEVAA